MIIALLVVDVGSDDCDCDAMMLDELVGTVILI